MRLRPSVVRWLLERLRFRVLAREPDVVIGGPEDPYLRRWWVIPRNRWFNIYLHQFRRSDDDRALHDHPWINCSILLEGLYQEHWETWRHGELVRSGRRYLSAGDVAFRLPSAAHRIELVAGPVWTLFLTGPRVREWGFLCPQGWKHWQEFTAYRTQGDSGRVGPGCDP